MLNVRTSRCLHCGHHLARNATLSRSRRRVQQKAERSFNPCFLDSAAGALFAFDVQKGASVSLERKVDCNWFGEARNLSLRVAIEVGVFFFVLYCIPASTINNPPPSNWISTNICLHSNLYIIYNSTMNLMIPATNLNLERIR